MAPPGTDGVWYTKKFQKKGENGLKEGDKELNL